MTVGVALSVSRGHLIIPTRSTRGITPQAGGDHDPYQLCDAVRLQLSHDFRPVYFDSLVADRKPGADLFAPQSIDDVSKDFLFSRCQSLQSLTHGPQFADLGTAPKIQSERSPHSIQQNIVVNWLFQELRGACFNAATAAGTLP